MVTNSEICKSLVQRVVDNMADIFIVFYLNEKLITWNKSVNRISGLTDKQISETKASDFFSGTNKEVYKKAIEETIKNGASKVKVNLVTKSKKVIPFEFHCTLFKDNKGKTIGISAIGRDISEKLEWYNAAEEKTNKFVGDIMNNISDPLLILDSNLKVISVNSSFYKTYNASPQTTLGSFVYNLGNNQWNAPNLRQLLEEILPEKKIIKDLIVEHDFPDTGKRVMKINAKQIDGLQIILFTVSDITSSNEANLVKNSLSLTQNIVNTLQSPYIVVDSELKVVSANNSFYDTFGLNQSEIERHYIYDVGPKRWEMPELKQLIKFADSKKQNSIKFQVQYDLPNIGRRSLSFSAQRLNLVSDKIKYILIVIEDDSERKRLEEEKNTYLSIAAHDLRTPMTVIKGYSDMLLGGDFGKIEEDAKVPLTEIYHASSRMIRMINDFLTISRIEQGRLNIDIKKFDIVPLVKEISAQVEFLIKEKKLKFIINKMPSSLFVWADADKVSEVIFNLFDNAIKFTSEGTITIDIKKDKESAVVSVSDTGEGISQDHQKNLFNKYFQIKSGQSISQGKEHGLGLGLYISRLIVEACGGKIWVESKLNVGSKFIFTLPCQKIQA